MSEKQHAVLGASSSKRWMTCPGSVRLSEGLPNVSSPYAREGTAAHTLAEACLRGGRDPSFYLGTGTSVEGEWVEFTQEMCDAVRVYVNFVRERMRELPGAELRIEQRVSLERINPPSEMFGTVDARIWHEETHTLHIVDYKHGAGVAVGAQGNPQLLYYALGSVLALNRAPREIHTTIVQPRADHLDGVIRTATYSYRDLINFKQELIIAALRTQQPDAPLHAGEHCQFCPALAVCPEQRRMTQLVAQSDFEGMTTPPAPGKLTLDELRLVLHHSEAILRWVKAVQEYATGKLIEGEEIEGWKLVEGRAARVWKDRDAAAMWLDGLLGGDAWTQQELISPAQAEEKLKRIKVKLPPELIEKKASETLKLARVSDRRPAVTQGDAADDFAEGA